MTTNFWWINIIIEYQKITNLLENASNQPYKFRTKIKLKEMTNTEKDIMSIVNLNSELQC